MFPKLVSLVALLCPFMAGLAANVDAIGQSNPKAVYSQVSGFSLVKGARVTAQTFAIDRVTLTLSGTIYFSAPVNGKHTGAVFVGDGKFSAPVPESSFEKANVRRLLKTDIVESDFTSAVFRYTDGSFEAVAAAAQPMTVPSDAQKLADENDTRLRKDTGANVPARLAASLLNNEQSGVFVSTFRGGKMKEFTFVFDPLTRIPTSNFDLNGGEKGLIFADKDSIYSSEVLMAFYSRADYERRIVDYSDLNDLVDI